MNRKVFLYVNDTAMSARIEHDLRNKLIKSGLRIYESFDADTALIFCVGGDGTLLNLMQELDFPEVPVVGINTGHLGFFQEVPPDRIDEMIFQINRQNYSIQAYHAVEAVVTAAEGVFRHTGLNEIAVKGLPTYPVHLNISINESFVERFSGDGVCVATPAGSTAYNYSLGGSIVDPRLNLLQMTPIAPMNSVAYRSFTSSILLPESDTLSIRPCTKRDDRLTVVYDGRMAEYEAVQEIAIRLSEKRVSVVRFGSLNFWDKATSKFL